MEVEDSVSLNIVNDFSDSAYWGRVPRKLNFSPEPSGSDSANEETSPTQYSASNRLAKPMRTLRLTENPATPGTIFNISTRKLSEANHGLSLRISAPNQNPFTPVSASQNRKRTRSIQQSHNDSQELADCNVLNNNVLKLDDGEESCETDERPAKRLNLIESNTGLSRYITEFEEKCLLGTGHFGSVYLCTNRMDGCDYAIKKSNHPIIRGSAKERRALNEVFAHAVLGKHENVVRYCTAWSENKHMLIQNEYCNGGSLQDAIDERRRQGTFFSESEVRIILLHLSEGLRYIHSHNLVHMDIKPGNIFISRESKARPLHYQADDSFEDENELVTYKFGDFGHVTSVASPPKSVEEGDARYLAMEVFHDDYSNLTKADIFALGLTAFEAAGGGPLKNNGPEWHDLRSGKVPELKHLNKDLNDLIRQMTHPDPDKRPSALDILKHGSIANKTKEQLERELQAAKTKSQILEKKIKAYSSLIKNEMLVRDMTSGVRTRSNARMVGRSTLRSHSTTEFGW